MSRSPTRILAAVAKEPAFRPVSMNDLAHWFGKKPIDPPQPLSVSVAVVPALDARIADARADMGEFEWQRLQAEWSPLNEREEKDYV